jgi:hypothetical protein
LQGHEPDGAILRLEDAANLPVLRGKEASDRWAGGGRKVRARLAKAARPAPRYYLYLPVSVGSTVSSGAGSGAFGAQAAMTAAIAITRTICALFDILDSILLVA